MGSIGLPPPAQSPQPLTTSSDGEEDELVVMVTGFAPFKSQYPINPSWSIASSLPPFLPPPPAPPPTDDTPADDIPAPRVRILIHPAPIRVSYPAVRALVPTLWPTTGTNTSTPPHPRPTLLIHVGMAGGRDYYSIERRGHRDGYTASDVDGYAPGDERARHALGEPWIWHACPPELESGLDLDDVWRRWRAALLPRGVNDVRLSEDAGHYLCDFIYYSSLAELWKRGEERRVVFLHVPVQSDEVAVARGRDVLLELIRALVGSRQNEKRKTAA